MADVVLSYSRRNAAFTRRLFDRLQQEGRNSWVDWEGIRLSANWWKQIQKGIESSTTFAVILSPESMVSPMCHLEIAHAISCGKRIVPVVYSQPSLNIILPTIMTIILMTF